MTKFFVLLQPSAGLFVPLAAGSVKRTTVNLSLIFTEIIAISLHLQYDMPRAKILTDFAAAFP